MNVLVTGGAGAIGSYLANSLFRDGYHVTVLDDLSSGCAALLDPGIRLIRGSICNDDHLNDSFTDAPEMVFHLAALFANQNSVDHPLRDIDVNGLGTIKILELARKYCVKKVLYTSSSCVYGNSSDTREESATGCFDTPYAITKFLGEKYCGFWSKQYGLDTVIVRPFNSYGPGEFPGRYRNVIPNFFELAMRGEPLTITGNGEEVRDFNFVGDTVGGMMAAMLKKTASGEIYNLASGIGTTIRDLAEKINNITGNGAGIVYMPRRKWDSVTTRIGHISKSTEELGYATTVKLAEGLERTFAWFQSHHKS